MQRAMAKEAEANREAQAKVTTDNSVHTQTVSWWTGKYKNTCTSCKQIIAADGEKQAARALREAAETMSENSTAIQLRYLQTLGIIATEGPSNIYFPVPLDNMGFGEGALRTRRQ